MKEEILSMVIDLIKCCLFFAMIASVSVGGILLLKNLFPDGGWMVSLAVFISAVIFGIEYLLKIKYK